MPRPKRQHVANGVWHVTQRATDTEVFFLAPADFLSFCALLALAAKRADWILHGYCLMTNHVHLLIQTPEPTLPRGMQFLFSTYVEEFNVRHTRRGTLVQGRYKATLVESEEHFLACLEYFANNPVAAGLCDRPQDWPWSSYAGDGELAPRAERLLRSDLDIVFRQGPDMSRWDTTGSDPDTSRADGWLSRPCWRRRSRRRRRSAPPSTDP